MGDPLEKKHIFAVLAVTLFLATFAGVSLYNRAPDAWDITLAACKKLEPTYNKYYEVTGGFYKGQTGQADKYNGVVVDIFFDNNYHSIQCDYLKEVTGDN